MLHVRILVDRSGDSYAGRVLLFNPSEYDKPIFNLPLDEFERMIKDYEWQKAEFVEQQHKHQKG